MLITTTPDVVSPKNSSPERSVEWWKEEIRNGIKYQELFGRPEEWRRFRAYYRHHWKMGTTLPVNMIFSVIRSMIPQIYFRNPKVFVTPTKPGMDIHARTVEAIDNQLIKDLDLKRQMKKVITDACIQGTGVMWRGYDSEFGWDPESIDPMTGDSTLTQYNSAGYRIEYNTFVQPGMPWAQRAEPESTILPWGCRDVRNAEWVAMRVLRPLKDVQADTKYRNTKGLGPMSATSNGTPQDEFDKIMQHSELVELFQIRDVKTGNIYVINLNHDKFLRNEADEMQMGGLPFHWFVMNEDPTYPWGIPDARIMEPQQLELNEVRKLAMHHRRVAMVKMLYKRGAIKAEEIEKLLDEDVKAAVAVDIAEGSIDNVIRHINSTIPQELNLWGEIIRGDIREVTGFGRNQVGQAEGGRTTATEAKIVFGAHEIRLDERRDMAADFLEEIVRGINQTVFKFWNTERVVQVVGPSGLPGWIKYTGTQLASGNYNYRIDPNNGAAVSGETRKADSTQLLQLWAAVGKGAPPPPELARYIFSAYEGINTDVLVGQLTALGISQNLAGASPSNPASPEQAQAGGPGVSPALTGPPGMAS